MRRASILLLVASLLATACGRGSDIPTPTPEKIAVAIIRADDVVPTDEVVPTNAVIPTIPQEAEAMAEAISTPSPAASAMPLPTPPTSLIETYVVQWGDTLGGISLAFDVPIDELVALNNLEDETALLHVGQALQIPLTVNRSAPELILLPDSEVVFSPSYLTFDTATVISQQRGYLSEFSEKVDDEWVNGAAIVARVARQFSVGPRVLLALLEHYGGWVSQSRPRTYQPLGASNPWYEESFYLQLSWAANRLNEGYYSYKAQGQVVVRFSDGERALVPSGLNAGTAAIQNILALNTDWDHWDTERNAFFETYYRLFGNPFANIYEPIIPAGLTQPELQLPWEPGMTFYYTGGPHAAYGSRSAWAAVDFAPDDIVGNCFYSQRNITAAADGQIALGQTGEVYLDLDADGKLQTGWVILYLHMVVRDNITHGQRVSAGDPIGYASCEGGISISSHLHLARRYNGEWMAAEGPVPMLLSGWRFKAGSAQYDGTAVRGGVIKTACECSDPVMNALIGE